MQLHDQYYNVFRYSEYPLECALKPNFYIFKIIRPTLMKENGDPRDNAAPPGFRYIYADELEENPYLLEGIHDNLKEMDNTH